MEQVLYKLPDGWKRVCVDDVCTKITDGAHKTPKYTDDGVPFLSVKDVNKGLIDFSNTRFVSQETHDDLYKRCNPERNDILYTKVGSTGVAKIVDTDREFSLFVSVALLKPKSELIDSKYFEYALNSPESYDQAQALTRGVANRNLVLKDIKSITFNLAPIKEQKRIVEKLDALLTRIDTAIEHLQSKLDLSKQLFDSVLDEFFKLSDCNSVPLTEVVDFIGGSQPPKSQFSDVQKEGYVRLIQIRDYKTDNHIVYVDSASTKKFCTKEDVMIGRYGPPVFQILRGLDGAYNVALMKAVPNEDVLTKDYLFWFLQSPSIQNYVIGISQRAAGQSGVNKKALEKYLIPVPSKTIQNDIVDKVGQLVNKSRNLEAEVTAEVTSLNQLKASILDSAFKGEL
jgi:type I restriction enzyme S subunit